MASVRELVPDTLNPAAGNSNAPLEEISFVFREIKWIYTNGGITHEDKWAE